MGKEIPANEYSCRNYFSNESQEKRTEAFTRLWVNVINQKESSEVNCFQENMILQTKIS